MADRTCLAEETDEALAERCRSRDHAAFSVLVDRYKYKVHWIVRRMVGSPDDEDLAQEVFVRAYVALPGFRGESKFSTWLFRITRNLCLSELRRAGRRAEILPPKECGEESIDRHLAHPDTGAARQVETMDTAMTVRKLMARLPADYRMVLTLFYLNQLKYEEISEIMNLPMGTVKTYIHRAKVRLRDLVVEDLGTGRACDEDLSR